MAAIAMNPLTSQAMSTPIASTSNFMDYTGANGAGNIEQSSSVPTTGFPQPFYMRPAYRFKTIAQTRPEDLLQDGPGRRLRKNVANVRKHIDYISNVLNHIDARLWQHSRRDRVFIQPDILYQPYVLPAASTPDSPVDCVLTKFVRAATNKVKCPVYTLCWTPEGKRLITGASSGEFTLWNGTAFNFETILQAHDVAVRALKWSHNDQWMASADHDGFVKYWQPNMNNVHMFQAHKDEPIRSISFSPTDVKIVTGSDDATARIWDFARCTEERILRGHGADVRTVDWHPTKGLVATGSRDSQQPVKLWDPKTGQCLATLHDHKNSVMAVQWNRNGNWLLTGSRDHLIKLYDIRMMKEVQTFRGHKKEVTSLSWHPIHEGLFVSGGGDGSLGYWLVNTEKELALLEQAHDQAVWTLEWHPLGHILATGSNDNNTKFWSRNRPGDTQEDIFGLAAMSGGGLFNTVSTTATASASNQNDSKTETDLSADDSAVLGVGAAANTVVIPGMGLDEEIYGEINRDVPAITSLPGLGGSLFDDPLRNGTVGAKKTLIKQPPPKRAQRQFERMWMVSRPGVGGDFEDDTAPDYEETGGFFNAPVHKGVNGPNGGLPGPSMVSAPVDGPPSSSLPMERPPKLSLLGPPPFAQQPQPPMVSPSLLSQPSAPPLQQHSMLPPRRDGPPSLLSQNMMSMGPPVIGKHNNASLPQPTDISSSWRTSNAAPSVGRQQPYVGNEGSGQENEENNWKNNNNKPYDEDQEMMDDNEQDDWGGGGKAHEGHWNAHAEGGGAWNPPVGPMHHRPWRPPRGGHYRAGSGGMMGAGGGGGDDGGPPRRFMRGRGVGRGGGFGGGGMRGGRRPYNNGMGGGGAGPPSRGRMM